MVDSAFATRGRNSFFLFFFLLVEHCRNVLLFLFLKRKIQTSNLPARATFSQPTNPPSYQHGSRPRHQARHHAGKRWLVAAGLARDRKVRFWVPGREAAERARLQIAPELAERALLWEGFAALFFFFFCAALAAAAPSPSGPRLWLFSLKPVI